jgi:hypothetical protein
MCPGGQIVPTAIEPGRLCVNGMSYSNRGSKWANSAVVVSVGAAFGDFDGFGQAGDASKLGQAGDASKLGGTQAADGGATAPPKALPSHLDATPVTNAPPAPLAGMWFQEEMERRAALMGGPGLLCPVQRVSDFLRGEISSAPLPPSSYRRGVVSAPLHELYPAPITAAIRVALRRWGRSMEGFDGDEALLHGVETRTSAPVQITRHAPSCECVGLPGLYPAGEGAGYAGGIVSAAVDGMRVAEALLASGALRAEDGEVAAVAGGGTVTTSATGGDRDYD